MERRRGAGVRQISPLRRSTEEPGLQEWMKSTDVNQGVDTEIQVVEAEKLGVWIFQVTWITLKCMR